VKPGGNNPKPVKRKKKNLGLQSLLEQNNRQLQIMNERIQLLETGGRATNSSTGHYAGDAAGRNYNSMVISTPLIDKYFQTQSDVNATQQNGHNAANDGSSQLSPIDVAPQHLFFTPQGQPYYAHHPTPSSINTMASSPNNWLAVNTSQGIMYQQQAIQNQGAGYNNNQQQAIQNQGAGYNNNQQQAIQNQGAGYNNNESYYPPNNNMLDYALLDYLAYNKRKR
jgi:hypothetical protein